MFLIIVSVGRSGTLDKTEQISKRIHGGCKPPLRHLIEPPTIDMLMMIMRKIIRFFVFDVLTHKCSEARGDIILATRRHLNPPLTLAHHDFLKFSNIFFF